MPGTDRQGANMDKQIIVYEPNEPDIDDSSGSCGPSKLNTTLHLSAMADKCGEYALFVGYKSGIILSSVVYWSAL